MSERLTPRQRARVATLVEIKRLARAQLERAGSAGLSLREVARELGVVSSAIYRYYPSRDDLLTELIVDAYDALGEVAEAAAAAGRGASFEERWLLIARAVRQWARANPAEYALIYGSPVPGYQAPPERTVGPATRVPAVLVELLGDLQRSRTTAGTVAGLSEGLRADLRRIGAVIDGELDEEWALAGLAAWSSLFGTISFELFGHFHNVITDLDHYFEVQMRRVAAPFGPNVADPGATN